MFQMDESLRKIYCKFRKEISLCMIPFLFKFIVIGTFLFLFFWHLIVPSVLNSYVVCTWPIEKYLWKLVLSVMFYVLLKGWEQGSTMFRGDLNWKTVWNRKSRSPVPSASDILDHSLNICYSSELPKCIKAKNKGCFPPCNFLLCVPLLLSIICVMLSFILQKWVHPV